jgi:hypothetical protein
MEVVGHQIGRSFASTGRSNSELLTGFEHFVLILLDKQVVTQEIHPALYRIKSTPSDFLLKLSTTVFVCNNDHAGMEILQVMELQEGILNIGGMLYPKETVGHLPGVEPNGINSATPSDEEIMAEGG